ncbi:hypothetical protein ABW21_db0204118 [Orbilia brochopaga]|nr:hypothetical protein ABW21_db0204118 [Drechslerella brochopaga]
MRIISFLVAGALAVLPSIAQVLAEYNMNAFTAPLGGDLVSAGSNFQVRWINIDGGIINLVLVRGKPSNLQTVGAIAAGITNTGEFNWAVPSNTAPGNDYSIEIQSGAERNYTPLFTVIAAGAPKPAGVITGSQVTGGGYITLVEKTTDAGSILTESYPIDATATTSEIVESSTLIFPSPTETETPLGTNKLITLDASGTYSMSTLTYPTTMATVISGTTTSYVSNATMTTSSLVVPTEGNFANNLHVGGSASLFMVVAGLLAIL